jgi:methyl halide transferase
MNWNEHYVELNTPWDLGTPSPVVAAAVPLAAPAPARILVPGFGWGWDVEALANQGYDVVGLEIAEAAVEGAAGRIGPRDNVELVVGDFFDLPKQWFGTFDVVVEHTCYCAFDRERWPDYVDITARLLKPGGAVAGAFLHFDGSGPPNGTNPTDLRAQFGRRFDIERLETWPDPFPKLDEPQLLAVFRVQDPALRG